MKNNNTFKLTVSGMVIALYVVIMYFTQSFSFGQYQIRLATSLYSLTALFPFLILPLGVSNFLSNTIMGGLGPIDMIGGALVGLLTSGTVYLIKKYKFNDWFIMLPLIFGPGLLVPIWLSLLLKLPYLALAISLCIGQVIPAILGAILVKQLRKFNLYK